MRVRGRRFDTQRLLIRCRWELGLFAGIPLAYWIVQSLALSLFSAFSDAQSSSSTMDRFTIHRASLGIASLGAVVLLGVSYPYVRRLGRDLLPLVWGYSIAAAAIAAAVNIGWGLLAPPIFNAWEVTQWTQVTQWFGAVSALHTLVSLSVLLWFARQASRFSLLHAFFLALITGAAWFPSSPFSASLLSSLSSSSALLIAWSLGSVIGLAVTLLLVWLLGNFESRRSVFRRRAIVALSVLGSVGALKSFDLALLPEGGSDALLVILFTVSGSAAFVVITLALAYLVRMRRPAVEAEA